MLTGRIDHTATLLQDGRVMIAGGVHRDLPFDSVEFYDPGTNRWINELTELTDSAWSALADMAEARAEHTATLLPDGRVLVTGGRAPVRLDLEAAEVIRGFRRSAEIYDPTSDRWSPTASMFEERVGHTATLRPDGRVFVIGGATVSEDSPEGEEQGTEFHATTEVYDPGPGTWAFAAEMAESRWHHSTTVLQEGTLLVVGGQNRSGLLASAELYDPTADRWTPTGSMAKARGRAPRRAASRRESHGGWSGLRRGLRSFHGPMDVVRRNIGKVP